MSTAIASPVARREHSGLGRPNLHNFAAHPKRLPGRRTHRGAAACSVERDALHSPNAARAGWGVRLKVLVIGVIAMIGGSVGTVGYISAVCDVSTEAPVAGDAAWAHVEP